MSDRQQALFTGEILKYWRYDGTFLWTHWSELGIPDYEKIFRVGGQSWTGRPFSRPGSIPKTTRI
jgi:hypothetical protein